MYAFEILTRQTLKRANKGYKRNTLAFFSYHLLADENLEIFTGTATNYELSKLLSEKD